MSRGLKGPLSRCWGPRLLIHVYSLWSGPWDEWTDCGASFQEFCTGGVSNQHIRWMWHLENAARSECRRKLKRGPRLRRENWDSTSKVEERGLRGSNKKRNLDGILPTSAFHLFRPANTHQSLHWPIFKVFSSFCKMCAVGPAVILKPAFWWAIIWWRQDL